MALGKVRIDTHGHTVATNWQVFLDDVDISKFVKSISISAPAGEVPSVQLYVIGALELPEVITAYIEIVDEKADGEHGE